MKKLNVALINPPSIAYKNLLDKFTKTTSAQSKEVYSMPIGILHLLPCIERIEETDKLAVLDYALECLNISEEKSLEDFIDRVAAKLDFVPDVLGFSLIFSTTHRFFNVTANKLKDKWPNVKILVGGTHATNCIKSIFDNPNTDYVIRGEAEETFPSLLKFLADSDEHKIESIQGVYSQSSFSKNKMPLTVSPLPKIEELPIQLGWDYINMELYSTSGGRGARGGSSGKKDVVPRVASIMTSRGCVYRCTFCSQHTVHGRKMRYFSIEKTLEMVRTLHSKYKIDTFVIEDDLFTIDRKRTVELLRSLRQLEIPNFELQVPNALSINCLNEEVVDELSKTGMEVVCLAIESGSQYVQKHIMEKFVNLSKAKDIVRFFTDRGVIVRCYFIMGFPKETKEHLYESIEYAGNLGADWCSFFPVVPLVGTKMYDQFVDLHYIRDDGVFWSESEYGKRLFDTEEIGAEELHDITYLANLKVNFIDNKNIRIGDYEKALVSISDIVNDYPFHIIGIYCMAKCYMGLKQYDKANNLTRKISELIETDPQSKQMYDKYGYLMHDFTPPI